MEPRDLFERFLEYSNGYFKFERSPEPGTVITQRDAVPTGDRFLDASFTVGNVSNDAYIVIGVLSVGKNLAKATAVRAGWTKYKITEIDLSPPADNHSRGQNVITFKRPQK